MSNSDRLLSSREKGLTFVVSAPAGAGKTTLVEKLVAEFETAVLNVSWTTRPQRVNEVAGIHYCFVSEEQFEEKLQQGHFLEHVTNFGYRYGTDKEYIEAVKNVGKNIFLIIDTQGAETLMKVCEAVYIFIMPPSLQELKKRLIKRGSETAQSMQYRLDRAEDEITTASRYDYVIVNDDLERAYQILRSIYIAETHRVQKEKA